MNVGVLLSTTTKSIHVPPAIESLDSVSPVNRNLGVRFDGLNLPATIDADLSNGSTVAVGIEWLEGSFNEWISDTYTIYGNPIETYSVGNPSGLQVSINVTISSKTPSQIGVLFNDSFARASVGSDYSTTGPASWTCDGSKLTTVNGTTAYTSRLLREYYQCFEEWEMEVTYQMTTAVGAGTYSIGVGSRDHLGSWSVLGTFNMSNDANTGKVRIIRNNGDTATVLATSSGSVTPASSTDFKIVLSRRKVSNEIRYTCTITRISNSATTSVTWDEDVTATGAVYANATGRFSLWGFGGSCNITNWKCTIYDNKDVDALFFGDSITHGLNATNLSTRFAANIVSNYTVRGGPSDRSEQGYLRRQSAIDSNPTVVFYSLGTNDVAGGIGQATYMANIRNTVDALAGAGIRVIILLQIPRNGQNIAALNTLLNSAFPNNTIIDMYTPLASGSNLNASYTSDNIHPNNTGHEVMITTIKTALNIP